MLKVKGIANTEKKIMIFDPVRDGDLYNVYSQDCGYDTMTAEEYGYMMSNPRSVVYMLVGKTGKGTLKECYDEFCQVADELKEKTDGKII